jgi:hypothetical protein
MRPALSTLIDDEAQNRALRRRQVLQEIITTESDYIFGLKALTNVGAGVVLLDMCVSSG